MYTKVHFGALKFLMFLRFFVLQCTNNGPNSSSQPLFSNLHAPRIILNPIMTIFKGLQFWLILADFELTVHEYSTFPLKSVFIFGISMIELVCVRIFSQNKHEEDISHGPRFNSSKISFVALSYLESLFPHWFIFSLVLVVTILFRYK